MKKACYLPLFFMILTSMMSCKSSSNNKKEEEKPEKTEYNITIVANDEITLTSSKSKAYKDETITLEATNFDTNYNVELTFSPEITYTINDELSSAEKIIYNFVMPGNDVVISSSLVEKSYNITYINFDKVSAINWKSDFEDKLVSNSKKGENISFIDVAPTEDIYFNNVLIKNANDEDISSNVDLSTNLGTDGYISFSFVMPSQDIKIELEYVGKSKIIYENNDSIESFSVSIDENTTINLEEVAPRSIIYTFVKPKEGILPKTLVHEEEDGTSYSIELEKYNDVYYFTRFTVPYCDIKIKIETVNLFSVNIETSDVDKCSVSINKKYFEENDTVSFEVTKTSDYLFEGFEATYNGNTVTWVEGTDYELNGNSGTFNMPSGNLTLKPIFKQNIINEKFSLTIEVNVDNLNNKYVNFNIDGESYSLTNMPENISYGSTFSFVNVTLFTSNDSIYQPSIDIINGSTSLTYAASDIKLYSDISFTVIGDIIITLS